MFKEESEFKVPYHHHTYPPLLSSHPDFPQFYKVIETQFNFIDDDKCITVLTASMSSEFSKSSWLKKKINQYINQEKSNQEIASFS
jgi:hypothetical protein